MHITLSPMRGLPGQAETEITVSGDTITVDGTSYDLSAVPEGGEATPQSDGHPFVGKITRTSGVIHCGVSVRYDDTAESNQPTDPAHWIVDVSDGPMTIPVLRKPVKEEADA